MRSTLDELNALGAIRDLDAEIAIAINRIQDPDNHGCHTCNCDDCTEPGCYADEYDVGDFLDVRTICAKIIILSLEKTFDASDVPAFDADWVCAQDDERIDAAMEKLDDLYLRLFVGGAA